VSGRGSGFSTSGASRAATINSSKVQMWSVTFAAIAGVSRMLRGT
jgi:hypothetical protein